MLRSANPHTHSNHKPQTPQTNTNNTKPLVDPSEILLHNVPTPPSPAVQRVLSLSTSSRSDRVSYQSRSAISEFASHPLDTGTPSVQIAALTVRIDSLSSHCAINRKDHHNRRGLVRLVTRRRKRMEYLRKKDFDQYAEVVKRLGLKALK